ncbi:helix-turn-helix domain-containing protein [Nocardia sp. CDC159]|uniref:Helix-turn-helix domain-containing protein n=1 Tax=Nocardia pulmonis TaxID=2951408 RepID=A0A9X2J2C9_9NOCA|nr:MULTISPECIES: helix-turn-helix transcriptional regulator [Nocardia]MCM6779050.1 helix-turn-helix domain-containing protein [Nocardia pulmonis]MCM6791940.1 helix-turn-helix domain-containing protein [Nocardia sp. CDC159]
MASPILASLTLGRRLQKLRERAGLSEYAMAKAVEMSPQTWGRLEDGVKQNVQSMLINAICDKLGASDEERQRLLVLADEVRQERAAVANVSWRSYSGDIRRYFEYYLRIEEAARSIIYLHLNLIPGLLQAQDYRRELAWADIPQRSSSDVENVLALLRQRQKRLSDPNFELEAWLPEAVLRQPVGGPRVMEDQLRHLLEVGDLPNVTIRAIPHGLTNPIAVNTGSFNFLTFSMLANSRLTPPPLVFLDGYTGSTYITAEDQIAKYRATIPAIRRITLDEGPTRDLILTIAREFAS